VAGLPSTDFYPLVIIDDALVLKESPVLPGIIFPTPKANGE
jgi:hypothetical protein